MFHAIDAALIHHCNYKYTTVVRTSMGEGFISQFPDASVMMVLSPVVVVAVFVLAVTVLVLVTLLSVATLFPLAI
uniref:Uncharacterized protein n=1 Tax=viral metagenome TaxID=1070528 RepID=A0A6C0I473_9ZZZZ